MDIDRPTVKIVIGRSDLRGDDVNQTQINENTSERDETWLVHFSKS